MSKLLFCKRMFDKKIAIPAAVISFNIGLLWTPIDQWLGKKTVTSESINSFNRVIGEALINNIDIALRVQYMFFYSFIYLLLIFVLIYSLLRFLLKNIDQTSEEFLFFEKLSYALIPVTFLQNIYRLTSNAANCLNPIFCILLIICIFHMKYDSKTPLYAQKFCMFNALTLMNLFFFAIYKFSPEIINTDIKRILITLICFVCSYFTIRVWYYIVCAIKKDNLPSLAFALVSILPALLSLLYELINILNQYMIYVTHKFAIVCVASFIIFFLSIIFSCSKKFSCSIQSLERIYFPLLILGFSMISVQPYMQTIAGCELFESSNAGSDIFGFLQYGELPFVHNFNPHMLGDAIGGILFAIVNHVSAIEGVYGLWSGIYVPLIFIFYYALFCQMVNRNTAFVITLLFPLNILGVFFSTYSFGIVAIVAANLYLKNRSTKFCLLYILCCAASCLYRADTGLYAIATVVVLTIILLHEKAYRSVIQMWIAGIIIGFSIVLAFILICTQYNINPLTRILQMVDVIASTERWAYPTVANAYNQQFFIAYLFIPMTVVILLLYMFVNRKKIGANRYQNVIAFNLGLIYILNYSRTVTRHNLRETIWYFILYTSPLFICLALWIIKGKKEKLFSVYLCGIIVIQLLCGYSNIEGTALLQETVNRQSSDEMYKTYTDKVERVVQSSELTEIYTPLKKVFDFTLNPSDTYLDFTGKTLLYALTERDKPVLINQSPSLLSSEYSQLIFINEIEQVNAVYALVGTYDNGIDGIPYSITHYLVAEYINENYVPLCKVGELNLWVKESYFDEKYDKIEELINSSPELGICLVDYTSEGLHQYSLKQLPYIWGNFDVTEKTIVDELDIMQNDIRINNLAEGKYEIEVYGLSPEIEDVKIPIWCDEIGGQDDLIWYDAQFNDGIWSTVVDVEDHKRQEGSYSIHVYDASDPDNLLFLKGLTESLGPNTMACTEDNVACILKDGYETEFGNYIEIVLTSESSGCATLALVDAQGNEQTKFLFDVQVGEEIKYVIRVSSDYYWYSGLCSKLTFSSDALTDVVAVNVLKGDINEKGFNFFQKKSLCLEGIL